MRGRFPCGCTYTGDVQASAPVCTCGQELAWALTERGKPMPVERGSANAPDGTLAVWRDERHRLRCRVLRAGELARPGEWRGRTHWGRCPDEARHRRGRSEATVARPGQQPPSSGEDIGGVCP